MVPHLERAQSTYKDIQKHSFNHTHMEGVVTHQGLFILKVCSIYKKNKNLQRL